jgi:hypothetical protein
LHQVVGELHEVVGELHEVVGELHQVVGELHHLVGKAHCYTIYAVLGHDHLPLLDINAPNHISARLKLTIILLVNSRYEIRCRSRFVGNRSFVHMALSGLRLKYFNRAMPPVNAHQIAGFQPHSGIAAANDSGNAQLAGDNRRMG